MGRGWEAGRGVVRSEGLRVRGLLGMAWGREREATDDAKLCLYACHCCL